LFRSIERGSEVSNSGKEVDTVFREFVGYADNGVDAGFNLIGVDRPARVNLLAKPHARKKNGVPRWLGEQRRIAGRIVIAKIGQAFLEHGSLQAFDHAGVEPWAGGEDLLECQLARGRAFESAGVVKESTEIRFRVGLLDDGQIGASLLVGFAVMIASDLHSKEDIGEERDGNHKTKSAANVSFREAESIRVQPEQSDEGDEEGHKKRGPRGEGLD